jgi:hypothetical protein
LHGYTENITLSAAVILLMDTIPTLLVEDDGGDSGTFTVAYNVKQIFFTDITLECDRQKNLLNTLATSEELEYAGING